MTFSVIRTGRLKIRPFHLNDWTAILTYVSTVEVMHYMPEGTMSATQTQAWLQKQTNKEAEAFAVVLQATDQLIGHIEFHSWFSSHIYEIGWVFTATIKAEGTPLKQREPCSVMVLKR